MTEADFAGKYRLMYFGYTFCPDICPTDVALIAKGLKAFEVAQRMASMVEFSREAMVGGTLEGIITSWNPAAEWMFGYSGEEMIGQSTRLVLPEDRTDEAFPVLTRIRAGQYVEHLATMGIRRDGTVFPVTLSVAPIRDTGGAIVGLFAIADDVSEQRLAVAATRGLTEWQSRFLPRVSHRWSPMTVRRRTSASATIASARNRLR